MLRARLLLVVVLLGLGYAKAVAFGVPLRQRGASLFEAIAADLLFQRDAPTAHDTLDVAVAAGLDQDVFATCIESPAARAKVDSDRADGQRFGVEGTPTLFINGRKIAGSVSTDVLAQVIRQIRETS